MQSAADFNYKCYYKGQFHFPFCPWVVSFGDGMKISNSYIVCGLTCFKRP